MKNNGYEIHMMWDPVTCGGKGLISLRVMLWYGVMLCEIGIEWLQLIAILIFSLCLE
jgi:hypothetical protein